METVIKPIYERDLESVCIVNPPYTVFGHSVLMPSFSISMTVKGLKEILSLAKEDDSLRITLHSHKLTEYEIIRKRTDCNGVRTFIRNLKRQKGTRHGSQKSLRHD
jgi:hypothetical protein